MIRQRVIPLLFQIRDQIFGGLAREAVDNRGLILVLGEQSDQGVQLVALREDGVGQILAVEAGNERLAAGDVELSNDVFPDALGCRRREGDAGYVGEASAEGLEVSVVGPEVVPPLGDAVRLVDGDEADRYGVEERHESREP